MSNLKVKRPFTNDNLRAMAWVAFVVAIVFAIWGITSDSVIIAFLTQAASSLGLIQARNVGEDFAKRTKETTDSSVDVSNI